MADDGMNKVKHTFSDVRDVKDHMDHYGMHELCPPSQIAMEDHHTPFIMLDAFLHLCVTIVWELSRSISSVQVLIHICRSMRNWSTFHTLKIHGPVYGATSKLISVRRRGFSQSIKCSLISEQASSNI
jgi:hypothetical protein